MSKHQEVSISSNKTRIFYLYVYCVHTKRLDPKFVDMHIVWAALVDMHIVKWLQFADVTSRSFAMGSSLYTNRDVEFQGSHGTCRGTWLLLGHLITNCISVPLWGTWIATFSLFCSSANWYVLWLLQRSAPSWAWLNFVHALFYSVFSILHMLCFHTDNFVYRLWSGYLDITSVGTLLYYYYFYYYYYYYYYYY